MTFLETSPSKPNYFIPENEDINSREESLSPSGKYKLIISRFKTKSGGWNYSQGKLFLTSTNEEIATIKRNYSSFPYLWIENHKNGHDYFVGGEDYQGQTVVELDTF